MPKSLNELATSIKDKLHDLGIVLITISNFCMIRVVSNTRVHQPEDIDFEIAIESLRDINQLSFIINHLDMDQNTIAHQKLRRALKDSALPQKDVKQSTGRDTQFELYIAAICTKALLVPIDFAEPDLLVYLDEQQFGIAAKRLKSRDNLEKNIRKAGNQIKKAGIPGIIAIDTCVAFNEANEWILASFSESQFVKRYSEYFRVYIDENE